MPPVSGRRRCWKRELEQRLLARGWCRSTPWWLMPTRCGHFANRACFGRIEALPGVLLIAAKLGHTRQSSIICCCKTECSLATIAFAWIIVEQVAARTVSHVRRQRWVLARDFLEPA